MLRFWEMTLQNLRSSLLTALQILRTVRTRLRRSGFGGKPEHLRTREPDSLPACSSDDDHARQQCDADESINQLIARARLGPARFEIGANGG